MEDFQKEFVPYEIALRMKQLEFDEPCMGCYRLDKMFLFGRTSDNTSTWTLAPLFQQAFRWFREKYNLSVSISLISIDNINIGFGNHNITIIDGEVQHPKKDDLDEFLKKH